MAHCWTAVSISGMSVLLPPFSSTVEGGRGGKKGNVELIRLQMVPLTWRTIRNCTMNNSAFCHFRGFPFCLYNSEHFLPSPFSLRRNRSWGSSLQGLPAAYHAGGIPRGLAGSPSWRHGPCACGPLCDTRPGHAHATAKLKKAFSIKMFFSFLFRTLFQEQNVKWN